MRFVSLAACIGIVLAAPLSAATFRAENKVVVTGQSNGLFAVPSSGKFGARGAWCAAADYAQDVLGANGTTRIFVRAPKKSNSGPVVFGLGAGGTTPTNVSSVTSALRTAGSNLSVDHAYQFCHDSRLINRSF